MEQLTALEGRVVACLAEKQLLTPQHYPLTLVALVAACNQTTSREPVTTMSEDDVRGALDGLKSKRLVRFVLPSHGRSVTRFRHVLDEVLGLDGPQLAVLAVLELRGPQTAAELRARTERMVQIESIEHELDLLAAATTPLVRRLVRRPGQKEERWESLLASSFADTDRESGAGSEAPRRQQMEMMLAAIEDVRAEVAELRDALAALRDSLGG